MSESYDDFSKADRHTKKSELMKELYSRGPIKWTEVETKTPASHGVLFIPEELAGGSPSKRFKDLAKDMLEAFEKGLGPRPVVVPAAKPSGTVSTFGSHTHGVMFPPVAAARGGIRFGPGGYSIDATPDVEKEVNAAMAKNKPVHAAPACVDGEWSCTYCGAESFDKEMFAEAGVINDCVSRAVLEGVLGDPSDLVNWSRTAQAQAWVESMKKTKEAVEKIKPSMQKQLDSMNAAVLQSGEYSTAMKELARGLSDMGRTVDRAQASARIQRTIGDVNKAVRKTPHWVHINEKVERGSSFPSDHRSQQMKWKSR